MLDPLSSVSLANAIVQFIDFGYKVVRGSFDIYQSSQGALPENLDLEHAAQDVSRMSYNVTSNMYSANLGTFSEDERDLQELAIACGKVADDLLSALSEVKASKSDGKTQKWASFRAAVTSQTP